MAQTQNQNPIEKDPFVKPSPGRIRSSARASKEGVTRENAERTPETTPGEAGPDECMTATYWG
jgi:hypothetical protein